MWGHTVGDLAAYAEGQLDAARHARVERHLSSCADCRASLQEIRRGIALAAQLSPQAMPADVAAQIRRHLLAAPARRARAVRPWQLAAVAVLAVAGTGVFWQLNRPWIQLHAASAPATRFEFEGRQLHERLKTGEADVTFASSDERALWEWLAAQGAPVTTQRAVRGNGDRTRFVPVGASVVRLGNARTSVLAYRIDGHPVTLALALSRDVADAPRAGWWSKRVLHRRDASGVNTLTWTIGGGTYVMISELEGAGQRACSICHTDTKFRSRLLSLTR